MLVNLNNTRWAQAYAALCLRKYCLSFDINHAEIDALILHLIDILITPDLSTWETIGSTLIVAGRGDFLPKDVSKAVPFERLNEFNEFLECVVEVGLVDMYGAVTSLPFEYLQKCLKILENEGIQIPPIYKLEKNNHENGWGQRITENEFFRFKKFYGL